MIFAGPDPSLQVAAAWAGELTGDHVDPRGHLQRLRASEVLWGCPGWCLFWLLRTILSAMLWCGLGFPLHALNLIVLPTVHLPPQFLFLIAGLEHSFFCLAYSGCRFPQHFDNSCDPGSKVREKSLVIHCKAGHELLVTLTRYVVRSPQCLLRIAHFW